MSKPSTDMIDGWTPLHILSGLLIGRRGWSVESAVAFTVGFEILENTVLAEAGYVQRETPSNMAVDMAMNMVGFYLGKKVPRD